MKKIYMEPVTEIIVTEEEEQLLSVSGVFSEDFDLYWGGFDDGTQDSD